jgi:hypothetical protein
MNWANFEFEFAGTFGEVQGKPFQRGLNSVLCKFAYELNKVRKTEAFFKAYGRVERPTEQLADEWILAQLNYWLHKDPFHLSDNKANRVAYGETLLALLRAAEAEVAEDHEALWGVRKAVVLLAELSQLAAACGQ